MTPDVALIAPYPPPQQRHGGTSGVASYTANLAHSLVAHGAGVTVLAPREAGLPSRSEDGGIRVERVFDRGPLALVQAARAAAASPAPVVHVQHETFLYGRASALPGMLGGLAWLRRRRPVVVTMHQVVPPSTIDASFTRLHRVAVPAPLARGALSAIQGSIPRLATATVVLEDRFREAVPRAVCLPHGVESPGRGERAAARARLGLPADAFVVLCFGYLAPYKGLEVALEAARRLDGRPGGAGRVAVVIAGGPHPRLEADGDGYADQLRSRFEDVARFTGYVPDDDVHPLFDAADVALLLHPRPFSSSGALALALGHDRPVLLSEALAGTLRGPATLGVASSPDAVAARLEQLAGDAGALDRLLDATRQLGQGRSWADVGRRHLELYEAVRRG